MTTEYTDVPPEEVAARIEGRRKSLEMFNAEKLRKLQEIADDAKKLDDERNKIIKSVEARVKREQTRRSSLEKIGLNDELKKLASLVSKAVVEEGSSELFQTKWILRNTGMEGSDVPITSKNANSIANRRLSASMFAAEKARVVAEAEQFKAALEKSRKHNIDKAERLIEGEKMRLQRLEEEEQILAAAEKILNRRRVEAAVARERDEECEADHRDKIAGARRLSGIVMKEGMSAEFQIKWMQHNLGLNASDESMHSEGATKRARRRLSASILADDLREKMKEDWLREREEALDREVRIAETEAAVAEERASKLAEIAKEEEEAAKERHRAGVLAKIDSDIEQKRKIAEAAAGGEVVEAAKAGARRLSAIVKEAVPKKD